LFTQRCVAFPFPKKPGSTDSRPLTLTSPRIKIIERSILNAVEPMFEGKFKWKKIDKSEYDFIQKMRTLIIFLPYLTSQDTLRKIG
jgi:hypothetical protein